FFSSVSHQFISEISGQISGMNDAKEKHGAWKAPPRLKRCPARCVTQPARRWRSPKKKLLLQ
ncbi:MAG: hypothetical protein K9M60_01350, partial [Akkermansiaceae bacterium]|nr:hypothetical protein [Akkermansiaceae bacterium]